MNKVIVLLSVASLVMLYSFKQVRVEWKTEGTFFTSQSNLEEVTIALGDEKSSFYRMSFDEEKATLGLELIKKGRAKRGAFKSKAISSYFVCTDCHNLVKEFDNPADQNPENRLNYARKNDLPFLPASTFWGIYNRKSFYNDDYVKKYGEIINKAKTSLPESIQVCAKYCSSGRYLKDWELEAIMHYFKQTELKISDLNLSEDLIEKISQIGEMSANQKKELLKAIDNSYTKGYSAHFSETMPRDDRKYGEGGDIENGKFIYKKACLYCHLDGRVTYLKLNDDKLSAQMFMKHKTGYDDLSIYQIIRQGTYAMAGRNQYMPRFTKDKMSDQQIEDLMAYIKQLAENK